MFEAVLFDFGGVITTSPFDGFAAYERAASLPEGTIRRINATDPDRNAWARFERGEIDRATFALEFEAEAWCLGHRVDAEGVLGALTTEIRPAMVTALDRLRGGGLALGLLTNNIRVDGPPSGRAREIMAIRDRFDVVVESSVAGCRKPEPRFYELACEALAVEPAACVFLDDLGVNLKPARAMGMTTIKVLDEAQALADLEAVVGLDLRQ